MVCLFSNTDEEERARGKLIKGARRTDKSQENKGATSSPKPKTDATYFQYDKFCGGWGGGLSRR